MNASPTLQDCLVRLMTRSHSDIMDLQSTADKANWDALAVQNWQAKAKQSDVMFQSMCPSYETAQEEEEDGVGNVTFINAGLMADEKNTNALIQALSRESQSPTPEPSIQTEQPEAKSMPDPRDEQIAALQAQLAQLAQQQDNPQPVSPPKAPPTTLPVPTWGDRLKSFLSRLLPLLAAGGISLAAAKYFAPDDTDTRNNFTIQAFDPDE